MPPANYAVALPYERTDVLARLRHRPGIFVLAEDRQIWICGKINFATEQQLVNNTLEVLKTLPGQHFHWDAAGMLTAVGRHLASGSLQHHHPDWTPLVDWLSVSLPASMWPAVADSTAVDSVGQLKLMSSDFVEDSCAVLTTIKQFADYVGGVPESRFQGLRFAATLTDEVFVVGASVPSVRGRRFWMAGDVAVPLGFRWFPAVDEQTLQRIFHAESETVIWYSDDHWETIAASSFTVVTRMAVRATLAQKQ